MTREEITIGLDRKLGEAEDILSRITIILGRIGDKLPATLCNGVTIAKARTAEHDPRSIK